MEKKRLTGWKTLSVLLLILTLLLIPALSCAKTPAEPSPEPASSPPPDVIIPLTAEKIAFDKNTITIPAGAIVNVAFTNKDGVVRHNFAVYKSSAEIATSLNVIYRGDFIDGGKSINYDFLAPSNQGTYVFRCDAHPRSMTGDLVVTATTE
ncbi:MAG: cupredoxin domain-containing protein [Chloroflexi bacterium]|nr:cupredoxin domain-containing protein [Chloroflexota bacterium]